MSLILYIMDKRKKFSGNKMGSFIYYPLFNAPKDENDQPNVNPFLVEFDKFLN